MLQITEYKISLKLGPKKHGHLITIDWAWAPAWGEKRSFAPPFANWNYEPKFSSKSEVRSLIPIKLIWFLHCQFICRYETHSAQ